jgi:RNA polymerase sigma-70 factor, ECF subfamily
MKCRRPVIDANLDVQQQLAVRDHHLVLAAQAGSPSAFADLQTFYARRLYTTIIRITKNREDAEDALQETFLHAYSSLHTFQGRSGVSSWLTRIAINSALMVLRKRRTRAEVFFDLSDGDTEGLSMWEPKDTTPNPEQQYAQHQRYIRLATAVRTLEPNLRLPLQLQMTDCSLEEIAQMLGATVASIKSRLFRARQRLAASKLLGSHRPKTRVRQAAHGRSYSAACVGEPDLTAEASGSKAPSLR